MGASGKWIKSLVSLKAPSEGKGRKWSRLWRSSSSSASTGGPGAGDASSASEEQASSSSSADAFSSVIAAVVRAPPRDFRVIRQEWAAVRIQAAFRAFLARRALRALRGIVRLQALMRGRLVRRQLAVTLKCMNALLRVQERARERRARCSADGQDSHDALRERDGRANPNKQAEEQWSDTQGSVAEIRSKMHMRHDGAAKRERPIAYARSHQPRSSKHSARPTSPARSVRNHESNKCNHDWSYIEGWMATKPWESRHMEQDHAKLEGLNRSGELSITGSKFSNASSIKTRRNSVTTKVAAMAPSALSASSSEFLCDEGSPSTSSMTPARSDSGHGGGPNYMTLTKSAKARQSCNNPFQIQRQRSGGMPSYKRVALSSLDAQSNAGSEISVTSRKLISLSLKGRRKTRNLDKENDKYVVQWSD